ncbi:S-adenosylmethionine decarboxylase proenzyme [Porphyridium purpureum]|uniref:adenosylmethionine decarboxylase n=1 Tax=Porphyridium purpureum TaxID=35688 RepID=A0A5J4YU04_PORPP|nr:S-adenosylmethionine decarboxylase proenzyme [Porphyridium purpureum]|eukprot:POR6021..scf227_4
MHKAVDDAYDDGHRSIDELQYTERADDVLVRAHPADTPLLAQPQFQIASPTPDLNAGIAGGLKGAETDFTNADLDATDGVVEPLPGFEGPEKKLEIDFALLPGANKAGFRSFPRERWDAVLTDAQCSILSVSSNDVFDAYLLSESSMFVYPDKVLIKTCGTTTLLRSVPHFMSMADEILARVEFVQYSRASFRYPGQQLFPHTSFQTEIEYLNGFFGEGKSYVLGTPDNASEWHLYVADFMTVPSRQQSLEIFMFDLDQEVMSHFFHAKDAIGGMQAGASRVTDESGIRELILHEHTSSAGTDLEEGSPSVIIDAHNFDPCGYSMNGMVGETYYTIHITPESHCSYVSFETNLVDACDFTSTLHKVISTFKPGRFSVAFMADVDAPAGHRGLKHMSLDWDAPKSFGEHGGYWHAGDPTFLRMGRIGSQGVDGLEYCAYLCSYVQADGVDREAYASLGDEHMSRGLFSDMARRASLLARKRSVSASEPLEAALSGACRAVSSSLVSVTCPSLVTSGVGVMLNEVLTGIAQAQLRPETGFIERPLYFANLSQPLENWLKLVRVFRGAHPNLDIQHDLSLWRTDRVIARMFAEFGCHLRTDSKSEVDVLRQEDSGWMRGSILFSGTKQLCTASMESGEVFAIEEARPKANESTNRFHDAVLVYDWMDRQQVATIASRHHHAEVCVAVSNIDLDEPSLIRTMHRVVATCLELHLQPTSLMLSAEQNCTDLEDFRRGVRALHWIVSSFCMTPCACEKVCPLGSAKVSMGAVHLGSEYPGATELEKCEASEPLIGSIATLNEFFPPESGVLLTLDVGRALIADTHFLAVPVLARRDNKVKSGSGSMHYYLDSRVRDYLHVLHGDVAVETCSVSSMSSDQEACSGDERPSDKRPKQEIVECVLLDMSGEQEACSPVWSGQLPALELNDCVVFRNTDGCSESESHGFFRVFLEQA